MDKLHTAYLASINDDADDIERFLKIPPTRKKIVVDKKKCEIAPASLHHSQLISI